MPNLRVSGFGFHSRVSLCPSAICADVTVLYTSVPLFLTPTGTWSLPRGSYVGFPVWPLARRRELGLR